MLREALSNALELVGAESTAAGSWLLGLGEGWLAVLVVVCLTLGVLVTWKLIQRLATLRATSFTPRVARLLSNVVASRDYSEDEFLAADGAEGEWIETRREGLHRLSRQLSEGREKSLAWGDSVKESFSDLRFTDANRVPFPFRKVMRDNFNLCAVVDKSEGPRLRDLDGNWSIDVSGYYGCNVCGLDVYKDMIAKGNALVNDLGPVLGPLHPVVQENLQLLKQVSGLDEASFHMSGTEAVMAACRLVRFNTRRKLIVTFAGAYHGWWDGVQPGLGCERPVIDVLVLKDMSPASLTAIKLRRGDIAGVMVNPVQCFHPNSPPPNDAVLLTSTARKTHEGFEDYASWLRNLRQVCTDCDIPLIFDEVYSGFRLAPGGGQEYFKIKADMVVYGKTLGGGLPNGVVCGDRRLMRRFDPERPMRLAYVVGTFSAHPYVMGAMHQFLRWATDPDTATLYDEAHDRCRGFVVDTNKKLEQRELPVRLTHVQSVWTLKFTTPSRYNWLLQYYFRAQGVNLSWVGTGRCLSSMDITAADYAELGDKLVRAAQAMQDDGWWLREEQQPGRNKKMKKKLVSELAGSMVNIPRPLKSFYQEVMKRKDDDHHASHSHTVNQALHILSSTVFLVCYVWLFIDLTSAMVAGLASLFVRQFGHAVIEPVNHDKEKIMLGFNTRNKTILVALFCLIPIANFAYVGDVSWAITLDLIPRLALHWFIMTLVVVLGRVAYLAVAMNSWLGAVWFVKLITDPITDLLSYIPSVGRALLGRGGKGDHSEAEPAQASA